MMLSVYWSKSG